MAPLISIIIPVYNSSETLREAMQGAINQSYNPIEIIIIDNNSTDDSIHIAKQYEQKYTNVRVYSQPKQGAAAARNMGIKEARGEWIQFLDADDIILPEKLDHQKELINECKNEEVGLLVSSYLYKDKKGVEKVYPLGKDILLSILDNKGYGQTSANLWRRFDLLRVGCFNEDQRVYNDPELIFRLIKAGTEIIFDDRIHSIYRNINEKSLTKSISKKDLLDGYNLSRKVYEYALNKENIQSRYRAQLSNLLLKRIRMLADVDMKQASMAFKNHIEIVNHLNARKSDFGSHKIYIQILKIFGFRMAEFIAWMNTKKPLKTKAL